jgi:hypothetical protein
MCLTVDKNIQIHFKAPESHIRNHAYYLWENAGQPPDKCFWEQAESECRYILGYKIVEKVLNRLRSPFFIFWKWQEGWNESDYGDSMKSYLEDIILNGFHVFLDPWVAHQIANNWDTSLVAIPPYEKHHLAKLYPTELAAIVKPLEVIVVHCYENDFLGAGNTFWTKDVPDIPENVISAVFRKVFVPKSEIERIFPGTVDNAKEKSK